MNSRIFEWHPVFPMSVNILDLPLQYIYIYKFDIVKIPDG